MTFTKTSQKFGQWSDVRANTVYGLGFSSEVELNKVGIYVLVGQKIYARQGKASGRTFFFSQTNSCFYGRRK